MHYKSNFNTDNRNNFKSNWLNQRNYHHNNYEPSKKEKRAYYNRSKPIILKFPKQKRDKYKYRVVNKHIHNHEKSKYRWLLWMIVLLILISILFTCIVGASKSGNYYRDPPDNPPIIVLPELPPLPTEPPTELPTKPVPPVAPKPPTIPTLPSLPEFHTIRVSFEFNESGLEQEQNDAFELRISYYEDEVYIIDHRYSKDDWLGYDDLEASWSDWKVGSLFIDDEGDLWMYLPDLTLGYDAYWSDKLIYGTYTLWIDDVKIASNVLYHTTNNSCSDFCRTSYESKTTESYKVNLSEVMK